MIEFKVPSINKAEAWCMKHIGPRLYYIHDRIGGEGWHIMRKYNDVFLRLEDDRKATMAMLMLIE
jgi:hypothetical protein